MTKEWLAVLVATIAALAAMISAFLNAFSASRSRFIDAVTTHRVRWIEEMRGEFTEFIVAMIELRNLKVRHGPMPEQRKAYFAAYKQLVSINLKLSKHSPVDEQVHRLLVRCIIAANELHSDELENRIAALNDAANDLFKEEWEKVKFEASGTLGKASARNNRSKRMKLYQERWERAGAESLSKAELSFFRSQIEAATSREESPAEIPAQGE